jgi:hypothetical protein
MSNITGTIEELKEVVLALHRSAAQLDEIIQEMEMENRHEGEWFTMLVASRARYREDFKQYRDYKRLEERENLIWQKLIDNLKKGSQQ